jgi:gamma-glutamyltranspeptidase
MFDFLLLFYNNLIYSLLTSIVFLLKDSNLQKLDLEKDIKANPRMADIFLNSNGSLVQEGEIIKNLLLADTLELLTKKEESFYEGKLGSDLVDELDDDNV